MSIPGKITAAHYELQAYVYVRQSTPKQVRDNRTSQENQYALVERAIQLGWPRSSIRVIDEDLGKSGSDGHRSGFQALVGAVSLGHVGIVLAYEASRLARNNADWYALLDLAAVSDTLIADADGVFDPGEYNDRLLLGLRGIMSEAELHLLRLRLDAGKRRQIEQGTYRQSLPTGFVRLPDGRVMKDPDLQVRHAIELVFERFAKLRTCPKVLKGLRDEGILLPRKQVGGPHAGQLLWRKPSESAIHEILTNPAYAGAFVYGRTTPNGAGHRSRDCTLRRPVEEWKVIRHDVYPAYIGWEEYLANRRQLSDNASNYSKHARGVPRQGVALLAGLVVCGRCGRRMQVSYKPTIRYVCKAMLDSHGEHGCMYLNGERLEAAVVEAFFAALAPAQLDLLDEVLATQRADHQRVLRQHAEQVQRAEYEVRLAERQYMAVDPDNRLVAAELERRWERALQTLTQAREAAERASRVPPVSALDPQLRAQLRDLGPRLPELWGSGRFTPEQKKQLLRSLIRCVILRRPVPDKVGIRIVWVSGAFSELSVRPSMRSTSDLEGYDHLVERIRQLSAEGYDDIRIAHRLTGEGFHSARSSKVHKGLVCKVRHAHGFPSPLAEYRTSDKIDGSWTISGLARSLGVSYARVHGLVEDGVLPVTRHPISGNLLVPDDAAVLESLRRGSNPRAVVAPNQTTIGASS